jgi:hypothetical protein
VCRCLSTHGSETPGFEISGVAAGVLDEGERLNVLVDKGFVYKKDGYAKA